jgi:Rab proteins geranylgeranyltransferase component A
VDRNSYYGGEDAGFSLQDARDWATNLETRKSSKYRDVIIQTPDSGAETSLKASRSYTLALNPQIVYAQSRFLPMLVSSQIHSQLEFQAVGSWWVHRGEHLSKIPSTREDVFSDEGLSMRDKRSLMKFLRFVLQEDDHPESESEHAEDSSLADALQTSFKVPPALQAPILALALSPEAATSTSLDGATKRIRRHMRSVGYFGPGFGAVLAKYGGNAEIAQVACRAQAVDGGVYLLGHGIDSVEPAEQGGTDESINVRLSDGTQVRSRWVVGGIDDLPREPSTNHSPADNALTITWHSIDIVASPMKHLFPATSENGPVPAAAIILVDPGQDAPSGPIYFQVHSEDMGECPAGQCECLSIFPRSSSYDDLLMNTYLHCLRP